MNDVKVGKEIILSRFNLNKKQGKIIESKLGFGDFKDLALNFNRLECLLPIFAALGNL